MTSSLITKATLLISLRLNDTADGARPLSLSEYHHLAQWLEARGLALASLLRADVKAVLREYPAADRLLRLLRRAGEVDSALNRWEAMGIWALGERDPEFPERLRRRLKTACLPFLFGAGTRETLQQGGLCVVGSRDSPAESLEFAATVGARAGSQGLVVISSDMRGIDREAISAALASGGRVICVLSDNLEKAVASKRYREALATGRASLVTPFPPDTRFAIANAMRANRYQYALSDAAIVVESRQTGGIWSGADENRKYKWVPAFVRAGANVSSGNSALLHLGLLPITQREVERSASLAQLLIERAGSASETRPAKAPVAAPGAAGTDLFGIFAAELERLDESITRSDTAVARHFGIELLQARAWLARARLQDCLATEGRADFANDQA